MRQIRQRQRFTQCGRTATQLAEPHAADGVYGEAEMRGLRTQQHHVAAATRTETEIVADDARARDEPPMRNLFDDLAATQPAERRPETTVDGRTDTRHTEDNGTEAK